MHQQQQGQQPLLMPGRAQMGNISVGRCLSRGTRERNTGTRIPRKEISLAILTRPEREKALRMGGNGRVSQLLQKAVDRLGTGHGLTTARPGLHNQPLRLNRVSSPAGTRKNSSHSRG